MPIIAPIIVTYVAEMFRLFGLWSLLPVVAMMVAIWLVYRLVAGLKADNLALRAEIKAIQAERLSETGSMLREMYRVTRETEQARSQRRELDERFLPIQEGMLQMMARLDATAGPKTQGKR